MSRPQSASEALLARVRQGDLQYVLGDIDDAKIAEIVASDPSLADLEQASIWITGDGDLLDKSVHPVGGVVA